MSSRDATIVVSSYDELGHHVDRVLALLTAGDVELRLAPPGRADLAVLDTLARLALAARRAGRGRLVCAGGGDLAALARLCGLTGVLAGPAPQDGGPAGSSLQVVGEPQSGEELGPEEVVDVRDPPA